VYFIRHFSDYNDYIDDDRYNEPIYQECRKMVCDKKFNWYKCLMILKELMHNNCCDDKIERDVGKIIFTNNIILTDEMIMISQTNTKCDHDYCIDENLDYIPDINFLSYYFNTRDDLYSFIDILTRCYFGMCSDTQIVTYGDSRFEIYVYDFISLLRWTFDVKKHSGRCAFLNNNNKIVHYRTYNKPNVDSKYVYHLKCDTLHGQLIDSMEGNFFMIVLNHHWFKILNEFLKCNQKYCSDVSKIITEYVFLECSERTYNEQLEILQRKFNNLSYRIDNGGILSIEEKIEI